MFNSNHKMHYLLFTQLLNCFSDLHNISWCFLLFKTNQPCITSLCKKFLESCWLSIRMTVYSQLLLSKYIKWLLELLSMRESWVGCLARVSTVLRISVDMSAMATGLSLVPLDVLRMNSLGFRKGFYVSNKYSISPFKFKIPWTSLRWEIRYTNWYLIM